MYRYVVVLRRAIPVNDYSTDTITHICEEGETVAEVMDWAKQKCEGSCALISVEITEAK